MNISELTELVLPAVLMVVKTTKGTIESVTVFGDKRFTGEGGTYRSSFGDVGILRSYGATFKMLDRKDSGLYTGKPLAGETISLTTLKAARLEFERIYKRSREKKRGFRF